MVIKREGGSADSRQEKGAVGGDLAGVAPSHRALIRECLVAIDNDRGGWWMASDGRFYPPETHPDYRPTTKLNTADASSPTPSRESIGPNARLKRLRYGGTCMTCGATIPKGADGWHDPTVSRVSCSSCPPLANQQQTVRSTKPRNANPAGGTSALAVGKSKGSSNWVKGAAGEYLMAKALHDGLDGDAVVLKRSVGA